MADPRLLQFVEARQAAGHTREQIIDEAGKAGWSAEDTQGALAILELSQTHGLRATDMSDLPRTQAGARVSQVALLALLGVGILAYGFFVELQGNGISQLVLTREEPTPAATAPLEEELPDGRTHTYTFATTTQQPAASADSRPAARQETPPPVPAAPTAVPTATPAPVQAARPTVSLTLEHESIEQGTGTTLSWSTANAATCTSTNFDTNGQANGSHAVDPRSTTTYTLACTGAGGSEKVSARLRVVAPEPEPIVGPIPETEPDPEPIPEPPPPPPPPPPLPEPEEEPEPEPTVPPPAAEDPGTFATYSGCEAPARSYERTVYIDPKAGSDTGTGSAGQPYRTLTAALAYKKLRPGDHVVLLPGDHGDVFMSDARNTELANASTWLWIEFQSGATAKRMDLRGAVRWLITGAEVSPGVSAKGNIVVLRDGSNVVFADGYLYNAKSSAGWGVAEWLAASTAMAITGTKCSAVVGTTIKNVRHGIMAGNGTTSATPSANSMKFLAHDNWLQYLSGDGMRAIGSDMKLSSNYIADLFVGPDQGDDNHDDGIQSYALNGAVYENIVIDRNWFQEATDYSHPYAKNTQGINSFGGTLRDVRIANNIVISSHYHGITWYELQDSVIEKNTVVNPTNNGRKTWILVKEGKDGELPVNVTVRNNAAAQVSVHPTGATGINNITVADPYATYTQIDPARNIYNLRPKAGSVLDGAGAGASWSNPNAAADGPALAAAAPSLLAAIGSLYDSVVAWLLGLFS